MGNVVIAALRGVRWGELRRATTAAVAVLVVAFVAAGATGWAGSAAEARGYDGAVLRYDRQADGASNVLADSTRVATREGRWSGVVSSTVGVAGGGPNLIPLQVAPSAVRVASSGIDAAPMSTVRTIGRGEKVTDLVNEAKALTFTTGNEHAVVKLANGDRVLIAGGPGGIELTTDVTLVYGHTHPYGVLSNGPSPGDYAMLDALDQPFSYVIDNGELIRFSRGGG